MLGGGTSKKVGIHEPGLLLSGWQQVLVEEPSPLKE